MATTPPVVQPLPAAPNRNDAPADFSTKADAFVAALPPMVVQENTLATWMYTASQEISGYVTAAGTSATNAANSATAAQTAQNAAQAAAAAAGAAAGLPSLVGNSRRALAVLANETGVSFQTQIKLISIEPLSVTSAGGAVALNVGANGVFNLTLTAAATVSFSNLPTLSAAECMVILVRVSQGATAYALTWPAGIVWIAPGGVAPATPNAGKRSEFIITIEGSTVYGRKGASN